MRRNRLAKTVVALVAMSAACNPPETSQPAAPASAAQLSAATYHYSPFVVQVPESPMAFDTITFKDVGLKHRNGGHPDVLLETIAESLALELSETPALGAQGCAVTYDVNMSSPESHLMCEQEHLYVDLWEAQGAWGYSLWSGCGDEDNFAKNVVDIPSGAVEAVDRVRPLARDIATALVRAHEGSCFQKTC